MATKTKLSKAAIAEKIRHDLETNVVNMLTVGCLAHCYGVNHTTITPIIRKLVAVGLLKRAYKSEAGNWVYCTN